MLISDPAQNIALRCCPYRCLEVHMSTLRVFYDKWLASAYTGDEDGDDSDAESR